jgi:glycerophosphoryl diester phosphodiesterase
MDKLVIAHRGASTLKPENTLAAFAKAMELGAHMAELDVRKTADNILVVAHDPGYRGRRISKTIYSDLALLSHNQIPTLQYALALMAGKIKLNIELKEGGFEQEAVRLIKNYLSVKDFVVTSFLRKVVLRVKQADPQISAGWILGRDSSVKFWNRWLVDSSIDFLSLHHSLVGSFSKLNMPMLAWTVDDEKQLLRFLQRDDIFAVVSNRPAIALRINNRLNS